jgi:hypothetical protein
MPEPVEVNGRRGSFSGQYERMCVFCADMHARECVL